MHRGQQRAGVQWAIVLSGLLLTAAYGFATTTRGSPGSGGIISAAPSTQDLGTPAKVKPGAVAVRLGGLTYRAGSIVRATISNGLRRTIYTLDSKTACSIAILERWDGK